MLGPLSSIPGRRRLWQCLALLAGIALVGGSAPLMAIASWLALGIYVLGSLGLLAWRTWRLDEVDALFLSGPGLGASLLWGGGLGGAIWLASLLALPVVRDTMGNAQGAVPLDTIRWLLFDNRLVVLLPLLVLAEETFWRGLMLSALLECGITPGWAVITSSGGFALNHLAVAPLPLAERGDLALMALPLGLATAVLTVRTQCLWGGALLHLLLMGAMLGSLR